MKAVNFNGAKDHGLKYLYFKDISITPSIRKYTREISVQVSTSIGNTLDEEEEEEEEEEA